MKKLLPLLFFISILISLASAVTIDEDVIFSPSASNVSYFSPSGGFTCTNLTVNSTCLVIVGGDYAGTFCFIASVPVNTTIGDEDGFIDMGICNASLTNGAVNFTYYDDTTDTAINVTSGFALTFDMDSLELNKSDTASETYNITLCTNLAPTYTLDTFTMNGTVTSTKTDYVTRFYTISGDDPTTLNLSNYVNGDDLLLTIKLFLIPINDSDTITFTWLSTQFQLLDGTMEIYKCNINGSKDLVESVPIGGGEAIANLELLEQPYSYEVIIDGTRHTDDSFTTCHVESSTARTFYVNLIEVGIAPVIGLFSIDCELTKVGNDTVNMQWSNNTQDTSTLTGCIIAWRRDIYNYTEIYRNCTNITTSMTRTITNDGNTYFVTGEITQGNYTGYCRNSVTFFNNLNAAELFGSAAVFAVFLLILSLYLIYAGDGTASLIAGGVGVIIVFFLGILNLDWEWVIGVIAFLIFVAVVGRYSKR